MLGRRVSAGGRTSAFVAGRAATAADLKALGGRLVAFFGQHEHRKLTIASAQMEVLDGFAGAEHLASATNTARRTARPAGSPPSWPSCASAKGRGSATSTSTATSSPRSRRSNRIRTSARRWRPTASGCATPRGCARRRRRPTPGSPGPTSKAAARRRRWPRPKSRLAAAGGLDPALDALAERVAALSVEVGDVAAELRDYAEGLAADPGGLVAIEERLEAIDRLERKHGGSVESVLAHAERCRAEIARLEGAEERGAEATAALAEAEARRAKLGKELSAGRAKAARPLEQRVAEELAELAMDGARLEVVLDPHPDGFGAAGRETVELRVAPNPGIEPAPLRDAASGGELSRVMLALSGLGPAAGAATLVFDEIDAGIGGNTARVVGERLRALGAEHQVLCITHLPQVASLADVHFRLEKGVAGDAAVATRGAPDGEGVVEEIRRMLGGERSDEAATQHARELLAPLSGPALSAIGFMQRRHRWRPGT